MAFELHQLEGRDPLIRIQIVRSMDGQECIDAFRAAIEHYRDVGVAGRVQVFEKPGGAFAYQWSYGVAEPVERLAQGPSPLLIPSLPAAIATAIGTPPLDAVRAAPRGVLEDLCLVSGRKFLQELTIVGELDLTFVFKPFERPGESHLTVAVMMAVAFAVGGHMHQLRVVALLREAAKQPAGKGLSVIEQAFKGDGPRAGSVVEEGGDRAAFLELHEVGLGCIHIG